MFAPVIDMCVMFVCENGSIQDKDCSYRVVKRHRKEEQQKKVIDHVDKLRQSSSVCTKSSWTRPLRVFE